MLNPNKICRILVLLNVVFFGILFLQNSYSFENQSLRKTKDFFAKDVESQTDVTPDSSSNRQDKQNSQGNYDNLSLEELKEINNKLKAEIASLVDRRTEVGELLGENNPFRALGAYSREYGIEYGMIYFNQSNYGISHDEDYCEVVDLYNLNNQENIFEAQNFFTDHSNLSLVRNIVMKKLGDIFTKEIYKRMKAKTNAKKIYLDHRINNFFTNHPNFHWYHQIGRNFLCATQMYNHIPGHSALVNKGVILRYLNSYIEEYKDRPQCFNRESLFPISYRLFDKDECEDFFNVIQSEKYRKSLKTEPLQYLIKAAAGVHKAEGVYLLNEEMTESLNSEYDYGKDCGTEQNKQLIAQKYISNPLLLAHHNKFDFRIYMLIASTNPLIVYYHDGFPRVSLHAYNTSSDDKAAHLTNSALSRKVIQEAREKNTSINDEMTPNQIKKYRTWLVEDLVNYLLEIGKIRDKKWLDSYLRPAFKKALVHLVRMAKGAFWNASNVYELHGVDFMLDDKLKLWFIESNPNPYLNTETRNGFFPQMLFDLFEIQYAYYRSRMTRILKVVRRLQQAQDRNDEIEYGKWKKEYQAAEKNRLEPEYRISKNNSFTLIMDENLAGHKAYFGHLERECV